MTPCCLAEGSVVNRGIWSVTQAGLGHRVWQCTCVRGCGRVQRANRATCSNQPGPQEERKASQP